jgi:hypothetical protein
MSAELDALPLDVQELHEDHPLAAELDSLRAALDRYQVRD